MKHSAGMNRKQKRAKDAKTKAAKEKAKKSAEKARKKTNGSNQAESVHVTESGIRVTKQKDGKTKYSIPTGSLGVRHNYANESGYVKPDGKFDKEAYIEDFNKAKAFIEQDKPAEAANILKELLKIRPDDSGVLKLLAIASEKIRNYDAALMFFEAAHKKDPDDLDVQCAIGVILARIDRIEESNKILETILAEKWDQLEKTTKAESSAAVGNNYMLMGEKELGTKYLKQACDTDPDTVDHLYNLATQVKFIKDENDKYFKMLKKLEKEKPFGEDPKKNAMLYYAFFDCYDNMKQHEKALQYAIKGAEYKRQIVYYQKDNNKVDEGFRVIADYFDEKLLSSPDIEGYNSELPIFVLGMPRSGTTLLEQIVLSHPDVEGVGEDAFMGHVVKNYSYMDFHKDKAYPLRTAKKSNDYLSPKLAGENYVNYLSKKYPDAKRIINKSIGNFYWIGYLAISMPDAKFIHIKRNAMDSCLSTFSKNFIDTAQSYSYDMEELGVHYRNYVEIMDHWNKTLGDRILNVNYEDLVDDLESKAREIIDFLGLPWDESCLEFYKAKNAVRTASMAQVRQPIYKSAIGRWKKYGEGVVPLIEALGHAAPPEAIEYLKELKKNKAVENSENR